MGKSYVLWQSGLAAGVIAAILVATVVVQVREARKEGWRIQPGADWDFSESWASTATAGTAAFAAFFGSSDVVVALKGDKATVAPVIVVASAIALGLVTVAPLVVKAASSPMKGESCVAIAVAAWMTVGAALFEGTVIVWLAKDLTELSGWGDGPAKAAGVITGLLLLAYAYRSLRALLESPTPAQVATDVKHAEKSARAAAIALAVAEAKAVAAATAKGKVKLAHRNLGGEGLDAGAEEAKASVAEDDERQAAEAAEQAALDATTAASLVSRRRAAIL